MVYYGYDGAGNIEAYTSGFLTHADLTQPLNLPVTEWVLSLEVGEHVSSKYEGMLIRNLHRHNCKGIILSWGILGQLGNQHMNNHSNDYVAQIFNELDYERDLEKEKEFRMHNKNYSWFKKSIMVFRRKTPTCDQ